MFSRVLVANRGEIAVRIIRTLRDMGITSVAMFSEADRDALFVELADEAYYLGPAPAPESYLNIDAILDLARRARVEAVHPGYGFLAENAAFAQGVEEAGMVFVGPPPEAIRSMGDKVQARGVAASVGVPVVPGSDGRIASVEDALDFGRIHGYPLAVKASGGGGGRGIRVVSSPDGMAEALERAQSEAATFFKNPEVYLERYYADPRHVEIQVLGDRHGTLIHLGERDCSVQRRHQKLIEEAPSPVVDRALRERLGEMALRAASAVGYSSAGTVEFLLTRDGEFFFLEMNTRIQVEHPVTELVADVDLVREMLLVAAGDHLSVSHSLLDPRGHAIEVRINAEDPSQGFRPAPGPISRYREPGGPGMRVDTGVYQGFVVPQTYDSMLAKMIGWGRDREQARARTLGGLREFVIEGLTTTIPFDQRVLANPVFIEGDVGTTFVERHLSDLVPEVAPRAVPDLPDAKVRTEPRTFDVEVNRRLFSVKVAEVTSGAGTTPAPRRSARTGSRSTRSEGPDLASPMHGTVLSVKKSVGDAVDAGEMLFIIEAMKMENEVPAHRSGTIVRIDVKSGATVETGETMARIE